MHSRSHVEVWKSVDDFVLVVQVMEMVSGVGEIITAGKVTQYLYIPQFSWCYSSAVELDSGDGLGSSSHLLVDDFVEFQVSFLPHCHRPLPVLLVLPKCFR